jgi:stearoyl-CoA desaturase (delta-9 desaturase)
LLSLDTALVRLALASYAVRGLAVTCVYHRYFAHRGYRLGRLGQLAAAALGATAGLGGPLAYAARDRAHHREADGPLDAASLRAVGAARAHLAALPGCDRSPAHPELVPDFTGYPELRWLDRNHAIGPALLVFGLLAAGGLDAALWGFALPTVALAHAHAALRSIAHADGRHRFGARDESRNVPWLAVVTFGEGWHNNHHRRRANPRLGVQRWEIDLGWLVLAALARIGVVRGLRRVRHLPE